MHKSWPSRDDWSIFRPRPDKKTIKILIKTRDASYLQNRYVPFTGRPTWSAQAELGRQGSTQNSSLPNPGPRLDGPLCTSKSVYSPPPEVRICSILCDIFILLQSVVSFLSNMILIQRAHKAPMKEIKTSSDLFQVEMTLMSQVHLLRTSISTLLNESPKI